MKQLGFIDKQVIRLANTRIDKYPKGQTDINWFDKQLFRRADSIIHSANLMKKSGGMSGGMPYAYIQDMIPYSIGDSAKSYIKDGYVKNALVYSAIQVITEAASKAKFKLFDVTNPDKIKQIDDHAIITLLKSPSRTISKREFIEENLGFLLLSGETFAWKNRYTISTSQFQKGDVGEIIIMPPQYMRVDQNKHTGVPESFVYYDGRRSITIPAEDMIYIRYWNPEGSIRGQSPLKAAREVIAHSNDGYKANRKILINGGAAGILSLEDDSEIEFGDDQIDALQEKFRERYSGPENYNTPIITNGKWSWTQMGLNGEDMQIVQGQRMSMRDICNVYGFSSQLLNDPENKTYNNMSDARKALITNCVIPKLHKLVDGLHRDLITEFEERDNKKYELVIDKEVWEEIREDQAQLISQANTAWWLTVNEKREMTGHEPLDIPEGEDIYVPSTMIPISTESDAQAQLRNSHAAITQGIAEPK